MSLMDLLETAKETQERRISWIIKKKMKPPKHKKLIIK